MAKATVVASRTLGLVFVTSMQCLQMCTSLQTDTSIYTVQVFRRISFDFYVLSSKLLGDSVFGFLLTQVFREKR